MTNPENEGVNLNKTAPANDLRIDPPQTPHLPPHQQDVPSWIDEATRPAAPRTPETQPQAYFNPRQPSSAATTDPQPLPITQAGDISSRKLVAGLLAIFLGTLGAHKFYLGRTTPGLMMLLVNIGGWFLTGVLSIVTFGIGALVLVPLMMLVFTALCIVSIIEGVVYLTRSDEEFNQTYLVGRKDWF
ncbi:TM2 domain-containing protein [Deinococcus detaillensis]|uniref:TM2 domain-containing protein n=1 Tax=Deinococcus detaillensis TaxID=2592048 RepID=A0A553V5I3_9DEIO|nr:TM2 domain-containing protein [Deinococcus detaillensis]TSA87730.1 TM2 domain-containing protein [Deinococcus detaillensis]